MSAATAATVNRGIALLLAIAALAALGVISLTGLALARAERVAGLAALARVQARGAAEAALAQAMLGWPSSLTPTSPDSALLDSVTLPGPARAEAELRALGGPVYSLAASGVRRSSGGELLGAVRLELLVLLETADSSGVIHPRAYPRGWRVLP